MRRALFCVALFATMPALAQTDVAVKLSGASYSSTDLALDPAGTAKVTFKNKLGYGASVSHYWTNHIAGEFEIHSLNSDLNIRFPDESINAGELRILSFSGVAQWHFTSAPRIDPYAGGGFAYMIGTFYPSAESGGTESVHLEDEFTFVANAGVNFRVAPRTSIGFDARYIRYRPTDSESGDEGRLDVNPLIYSVVMRYRF